MAKKSLFSREPWVTEGETISKGTLPNDEKLLLTFKEWLCEGKDNIPFNKLSKEIQLRLKIQYDYDKTHRLSKQLAKAKPFYEKEKQKAVKQERERIFREMENNCRAYEETPGYVQMKFYRKWWQALKGE